MTDDTKKLITALRSLLDPAEELTPHQRDDAALVLVAAALPPCVVGEPPGEADEVDIQRASRTIAMLDEVKSLVGEDSPVYARYEARHEATEAWLDEVAELGWAQAGGAA